MKRNAENFCRVGTEIFGPSWVNPMSEALDVNRRTISRWANGDYDIPAGVWPDIAALCEEQGRHLAKLAKELRE